jgi:hypothetical protein
MTYAQSIKYAPEPEHPEYYVAPEIEDDEITQKAIELLEKDGDLLADAMNDCKNTVIKIAGHDPRTLAELERQLLQGKHNSRFAYMQHVYLEGIAEHSVYLRKIAEATIEEERKENEAEFRWAA